jgi:predicted metal-dependent phosphoesterase TrpH
MPVRSPFTTLCQTAARLRAPRRADLHVHTTHSDGELSPAEVVAGAASAGLAAVAITDHDSLAGVAEATRAARGVEVVAGVEITAEYRGAELHLLGYFLRPDDLDLGAALERVRRGRRERFRALADRAGLDPAERERVGSSGASLGRRHLAAALVRAGRCRTLREAFVRHLSGPDLAEVPKVRLPVAEAIRLVRGAGGVASWAHPPDAASFENLQELRAFGLGAVEAEYPGMRPARRRRLREWADQLGLAVTGGSDCHGPQPNARAIGTCGVTMDELERLRPRSGVMA